MSSILYDYGISVLQLFALPRSEQVVVLEALPAFDTVPNQKGDRGLFEPTENALYSIVTAFSENLLPSLEFEIDDETAEELLNALECVIQGLLARADLSLQGGLPLNGDWSKTGLHAGSWRAVRFLSRSLCTAMGFEGDCKSVRSIIATERFAELIKLEPAEIRYR